MKLKISSENPYVYESEECRQYEAFGKGKRAQQKYDLKQFVRFLEKRWRGYEENPIEGIYRTTFAMDEDEWQFLKKQAEEA